MKTLCPESRLRTAPNWPKIRKMAMMSQFSNMTPSLIFFWSSFVSLVMFSYCSKFHVNIVTAFWIMTIFFYKGLTREPEMGNTLVWVLPNIWRLGWVMDTKFGTNVSNRMLLNAANFQGYSFYRFWVIKGKPTQIRVKNLVMCFVFSSRDISSLTIYIQISMKKKVVLVSTFSSVNLFLLIEAS